MNNASQNIIPSSFYAGDINSLNSWKLLEENKNAILIDVRTKQEWDMVGLPDTSSIGTKIIALSFRQLPHMDINKKFAEELEHNINDKETPLFFICKAGGRSMEAAALMASKGYGNCYNIFDGFEGTPSATSGSNNGWKNVLPWRKA